MTTKSIPHKSCSVAECENTHLAKGYCRKHYKRLRVSDRICTIVECDRIAEARNLCDLHYKRWRKTGDPLFTQTNWGTGRTPEERFWSRVNKDTLTGCWEWTGKPLNNGYAAMWWKGKTHSVHRISWELFTGSMPTLCILHACDNPICVNPAHLSEGTQLENVADMVRKKRAANRYTGKLVTQRRYETNPEFTQAGQTQGAAQGRGVSVAE